MAALLEPVEASMMHRRRSPDEVKMVGKGWRTEAGAVRRPRGQWNAFCAAAAALAVVGMAVAVQDLLGLDRVNAQAAPTARVVERPLAEVAATKNHDPYPLVVANEDGVVGFSVAEFADGAAHYYTLMVDGRPVEFFIIQDKDGVLRTAYNACEVCYRAKLGYRQDGRVMVCNNCGSRFPIEQINTVRGGCNPAPLEGRLDGDDVVIKATDIAAGLSYF